MVQRGIEFAPGDLPRGASAEIGLFYAKGMEKKSQPSQRFNKVSMFSTACGGRCCPRPWGGKRSTLFRGSNSAPNHTPTLSHGASIRIAPQTVPEGSFTQGCRGRPEFSTCFGKKMCPASGLREVAGQGQRNLDGQFLGLNHQGDFKLPLLSNHSCSAPVQLAWQRWRGVDSAGSGGMVLVKNTHSGPGPKAPTPGRSNRLRRATNRPLGPRPFVMEIKT